MNFKPIISSCPQFSFLANEHIFKGDYRVVFTLLDDKLFRHFSLPGKGRSCCCSNEVSIHKSLWETDDLTHSFICQLPVVYEFVFKETSPA